MKISKNILQWLNPNIRTLSSEDIKQSLESLGLETDKVEERFSSGEGKNLVFARLVSVSKVQNSDKLSLCSITTLEDGERYKKGSSLEIVCGGNNLVEDTLVIVALPGQVIQGMKIEKRKVMGVSSEGMICSMAELGITGNSFHEEQGIARFTTKRDNTHLPFLDWNKDKKAVDLFKDTIFDCEFVHNVNYLQSTFLLSKLVEIMFLLSKGKKSKDINVEKYIQNNISSLFVKNKSKNNSLEIDSDLTKIIKGQLFEVSSVDVMSKYKEIPKEIFVSLNYVGFNLINPYVDYFNLLSYLSGQPMHQYDADNVKKIRIESLKKDFNSFVAIGNKKINLKKSTVVVKNNEGEIIAVPAIIGSQKYSIKRDVKKILVEVLSIPPHLIRNSLKDIPITSVSSDLGKKHTSPFIHLTAKSFFLNKKFPTSTLATINKSWFFGNIGLQNSQLGLTKIIELFKLFQITLAKETKQSITWRVPFWLNNFSKEEDMIQLAYLLLFLVKHYDVVSSLKPSRPSQPPLDTYLQWEGYTRVLPYTLTDCKKYDLFQNPNLDSKKKTIMKLQDEMSNRYQVISSSLIASMMPIIETNSRYQKKNIKVFATKILPENLTEISRRVCLVHCFESKNNFEQFYQELLENIQKIVFLEAGMGIDLAKAKETSFTNFANTQNILMNGNIVGTIGEIKPSVTSLYKTEGITIFAEINVSKFKREVSLIERHKRISKMPNLVKEMTFTIDSNISSIEIEQFIKSYSCVDDCKMIDLFIEEDKRLSVTFQINFFQKQTISDLELNEMLKKIEKNIKVQVNRNITLKGNL